MAEQETIIRATLLSKRFFRLAGGVFAFFVALALYVMAVQRGSAGTALFLVVFGAILAGMLVIATLFNQNRRIRVTAHRISANGIDRFDVGFAEIGRVEAVKIRGPKGMCFWRFFFWPRRTRAEPIAHLDTRGFPPQELANAVLSPMARRGIILDPSIEQWRMKPIRPCSVLRPRKAFSPR